MHARDHRRPARRATAILALAAAAGLAAPASAAEPIVVQVMGGGDTVIVEGSDLLDILEAAIESNGAFAQFDGAAFTVLAEVGGVSDVVSIAVNAAGTEAELSFPLTGFSMTFTGANPEELQDAIEDFIEDDGADEYALVVEELNRRSVIAVVDGNPGSATARLGQASFRRWGLSPTWSPGITVGGNAVSDGFRFGIDPMIQTLQRGDFDSTAVSIDASAVWALNDNVGIALSGLAVYEEIESANLFQGGLELALPISILGDRDHRGAAYGDDRGEVVYATAIGDISPIRLQLTPFASYGLGGSVDLGQGASFWGLGGAASLAIDIGDLTLSGGASLTHFGGVDLSWDDYEFETEVDQQLLTVGGQLAFPVAENLVVIGGLNWSNYLDDAAIDDWFSPEFGLSYGTPNFSARLGWIGTFSGNDAGNVDGHALRLGLNWAF